MADLRVGQIVGEKYRIDALLGAGGMGIVVAATHVELGQKVAIKFLMDVEPRTVARFQREGRVLVRLKSPHVARVFDVDVLEDETPYIVMEHLEGQDLAGMVGAVGRLPYGEVVDYVLQACDAIAEAHSLGVVHRDLKPANVFLAKGRGGARTVKVLDFGISKRVHTDEAPASTELTSEGVAIGSAGYMAPEQISNARDVDARADVYALGALMFALIAATPPYKGDSPFAILAQMSRTPVPSLRALVPEVPESLAATIERCLAQAPEARWPTVAHLAQALAPFATSRGELYIKQISATLGVELPDAVASADTLALAPPNGVARHPSSAPLEATRLSSGFAPSTPPPPVLQSLPLPTLASMTTGTAARRRSSLALVIAATLGVVAVIFAGTAWKTFTASKLPRTAAAAMQPVPVPTSEPAATPASTAPATPTVASSQPEPKVAAPIGTSAPSPSHAPRPTRQRTTSPHVTPGAEPPNAATMPASRR